MKTLKNTLVIGSILLLAYYFAGHDYLKFFLGDKSEMLDIAGRISQQCNTDRSCPTALTGWQSSGGKSVTLSKDNMLYFASSRAGNDENSNPEDYSEFRLVYRFFLPDHWFEAQGGVDKPVTSGWHGS